MALSFFDDPAAPPAPDAVARALGASAAFWTGLLEHVHRTVPEARERWHNAGVRYGWTLRIEKGDRTLLYLTPQEGAILVGLVLGERAALAAEQATLPGRAATALRAAPKYAEGRGIRIPVSSSADVAAVEALLPFKTTAPARAPKRAKRPPKGT